MPDFGAFGIPKEPQLERRRICREIFTLDKWTSMTAYGADHGAPAGLEHPKDSTSRAARGATGEPSPSSEPRIAIPIIEYRGLCHTFQALATSQSILTQQMTALPPEHATPIPPEPSQAPHFVEQTMPFEEPTTGEAKAAEPSSPHHPPPPFDHLHSSFMYFVYVFLIIVALEISCF
ncbi:hypothetical protein CK203_062394 [Vitis vinifera]|uniref:Uncharacterized protein n=1 Tax=Vitis vinifera TaxID=29760 RepID=A0A438FSM7_VITVI|nr:hypothetical protein CK203_062394 [Vitis vinifera]